MPNDITQNKFDEWTRGLNPRDARISLFEHIRNIPYAIIPALRDPVLGPVGLINENHGSCQPKHFLLYKYFEKLNIPVKLVSYHFRWSEQPIKYPPELKKIVGALPMPFHLATKAFINGKWVLVDVTYDLPLEKAGFPVTRNWDGVSDTKNAVIPVEEIIHDNLADRIAKDSANKAKFTEDQLKIYGQFIEKLNGWTEALRDEAGT